MSEEKLKVLQVNKLYHPWIGGIETVVKEISEGLKDIVDLEVLVCQPKGKTIVDKINDVKVTKVRSLGIFHSMPISLSFIRYFKKLSKDKDIIHLHYPFPLGDLACLLSGYKGKIILWWHSDIIKQKLLFKLYKPLMKWLLNRSDIIIAATAGHIEGSKYLKEYKKKCKIIPYGIDIEEYKISETQKILTKNLTEKSNKKILFVGRLVYYKGVMELVGSMEGIEGGELFIVGDGPMKEEIEREIQSKGLKGKIHLMGKLRDKELKGAFKDSDIFVLPSIRRSEAFGLVQLEAMVYGKPVINTRLGTGVEYVSKDNETGLTVTPGNIDELREAIKEMINNDKEREKMGKRAKEIVMKEYRKETMIKKVFKEYKDLIYKKNI